MQKWATEQLHLPSHQPYSYQTNGYWTHIEQFILILIVPGYPHALPFTNFLLTSKHSLSRFQVSMAVLLDNFVTASNVMDETARELQLQERKALSQFQNPLQPLFFRLANRSREWLVDIAIGLPWPVYIVFPFQLLCWSFCGNWCPANQKAIYHCSTCALQNLFGSQFEILQTFLFGSIQIILCIAATLTRKIWKSACAHSMRSLNLMFAIKYIWALHQTWISKFIFYFIIQLCDDPVLQRVTFKASDFIFSVCKCRYELVNTWSDRFP